LYTGFSIKDEGRVEKPINDTAIPIGEKDQKWIAASLPPVGMELMNEI